jgi:hypothetical protein
MSRKTVWSAGADMGRMVSVLDLGETVEGVEAMREVLCQEPGEGTSWMSLESTTANIAGAESEEEEAEAGEEGEEEEEMGGRERGEEEEEEEDASEGAGVELFEKLVESTTGVSGSGAADKRRRGEGGRMRAGGRTDMEEDLWRSEGGGESLLLIVK